MDSEADNIAEMTAEIIPSEEEGGEEAGESEAQRQQREREAKSGKGSKSSKTYAYQYYNYAPAGHNFAPSVPTTPAVVYVPAPVPPPTYYAGAENYYYKPKSGKSQKSAKSVYYATTAANNNNVYYVQNAKSGKSNKSAKGYYVAYVAPPPPPPPPPRTPRPTPQPTNPSPTPSPTATARTAPLVVENNRCAGDSCTVKSWCRSRYGTCGPGRLYCNDLARWTRSCPPNEAKEEPRSRITPPPTMSPTWKPTLSPIKMRMEDESANFLNMEMDTLLVERGEPDNFGALDLEDTIDLPLPNVGVSTRSSEGGATTNASNGGFPAWAIAVLVIAVVARLAVGLYAKRRRWDPRAVAVSGGTDSPFRDNPVTNEAANGEGGVEASGTATEHPDLI